MVVMREVEMECEERGKADTEATFNNAQKHSAIAPSRVTSADSFFTIHPPLTPHAHDHSSSRVCTQRTGGVLASATNTLRLNSL